MFKRLVPALLPLLLLLALPLLLRPAPEIAAPAANADTLVILTPHADAIRREFGSAFAREYFRKTGRKIEIDWRSPGGTTDIVRYVNDRYEAAFRRFWLDTDPAHAWTPAIAAAFRDPQLDQLPPGMPPTAPEYYARQAFLASNVSIGADLFWGGGTYDHHKQAQKGYAVPAGLEALHPEWFNDAVLPLQWGGEKLRDPAGRYYGVCLATFGICYNPDRVAQLADPAPPRQWRDLAEPRFFNTLCVADPTKSGSISKCFEVMIQQAMAEAAANGESPATRAQGWADGLNRIKRIIANARNVTESAGKVTRDVSSGESAAGIAIDFYALSEAEYAAFQTGRAAVRIAYAAPVHGSSVSADPVQLLRGAPHPEAARAFIEFLLSEPGQQLWAYRAGVPGGPREQALRRPPIRRDLYTEKHRPFLADPDYDPYRGTAGFVYRSDWTGAYFSLIRVLVRTLMLDAQPELCAAWQAIIAAGGEAAVPEATAEFNRLPFAYDEAPAAAKRLSPAPDWPVERVIELRRQWTLQAIDQYRRAAELARAGR